MEKAVVNKIRNIFDKHYFTIDKVFDGGSVYLFMIRRNDLPKGEEPLDPWYTIDKKTLKIKGFQPFENRKLFNEAIKHQIV